MNCEKRALAPRAVDLYRAAVSLDDGPCDGHETGAALLPMRHERLKYTHYGRGAARRPPGALQHAELGKKVLRFLPKLRSQRVANNGVTVLPRLLIASELTVK